MRLGIGTYSLAWHISEGLVTHKDLLLEAIRLGVQSVQYCDNLPLDSLPPDELDDLLGMAEANGIVVEPGTRGLDEHRLRKLADVAHRTGCGFVRVVVDQQGDEPTPEQAVERMRFWRDSVPEGIRLAVENHDRFPARVLASMIEKLGTDRYGVCLDTANSLGCLEGTEHVVTTLAPYTVNLHIKDIRIRRVWHNMGFTVSGTPAGQGNIDIPWLIDQVRPTAESAIIEIWAAQETAGVAPLAEERRMLGESVPHVRTLLSSR